MKRKENIEQGPRHALSSKFRIHAGFVAIALAGASTGYFGTEIVLHGTNKCPEVSQDAMERAERSLEEGSFGPQSLTFKRGIEQNMSASSFFEQYGISYFTDTEHSQIENDAWKRQELRLMLAFSTFPVEYVNATEVSRVGMRYSIKDARGQANRLRREISLDYQDLSVMSDLEIIDLMAHELFHLYDASYCDPFAEDSEFAEIQIEHQNTEAPSHPYPGYVSEYSTVNIKEAKAESARIHIDLNTVDATARARVALVIARVEERVPGFANWMASQRIPGFLVSTSD